MFYDNFIRVCSEKGVKPTPLLIGLNISRGNLNSWKKGSNPSVEVATKMCEALSCSMDELLGIEKPATPEWEIKKPDWILDISDLSEKDRKEVIAIIEMKRRNQ